MLVSMNSVFRHSLDAKKRLFIPAKHREILGESFMIFKSIRGNRLMVYSLEEWEKYIAPFEKLPRKEAEMLNRYINSSAIQAEPDSQGRVVLNDDLIAHAHLIKDAVIVGCGKYAEIWSAEDYRSQDETVSQTIIAASLEEHGL